MKRLLTLAALCCTGLLGVAQSAAAAPTPLQVTVTYLGIPYTHNYTVEIACGTGAFTGTGSYDGANTDETISGTIAGGTITGHSVYGAATQVVTPGYFYDFTGAVAAGGSFTGTGTDSGGAVFDPVTGTGATVPACEPPPATCDKPGNGYGDKNHDHCGPPGQVKKATATSKK